MSNIRVQLDFTVPGTPFRLAAAAGLLILLSGELGSENVTLTSYYPAPSGVYTQMITTNNSYIARDGGVLDVGTTAGLPAGTKMAVMGGSVGIGTTSPGKMLSVNKGATAGDGIVINGTNDTRVTIGQGQPTAWSWANGWATPGDLSLVEEGVSGSRIYVKPGGNVGIGTAAPIAPLNVNGQIVAGGVVAPPGSEPFTSEGAGSGISMDDRAGGGNPRWVVYPTGGALNVYNGLNGVGVVFGQKGYVYINNANTACGGTTVPMNDVAAWKGVCTGAQFATWTQGFYIEGISYQSLGAPNYAAWGSGTIVGNAQYLCCSR